MSQPAAPVKPAPAEPVHNGEAPAETESVDVEDTKSSKTLAESEVTPKGGKTTGAIKSDTENVLTDILGGGAPTDKSKLPPVSKKPPPTATLPSAKPVGEPAAMVVPEAPEIPEGITKYAGTGDSLDSPFMTCSYTNINGEQYRLIKFEYNKGRRTDVDKKVARVMLSDIKSVLRANEDIIIQIGDKRFSGNRDLNNTEDYIGENRLTFNEYMSAALSKKSV